MNKELKHFRESKNMSQLEFSQVIGVSLSYYTKIEGLNRNPSFNFLKKIKNAFSDIDIEKIFFNIN